MAKSDPTVFRKLAAAISKRDVDKAQKIVEDAMGRLSTQSLCAAVRSGDLDMVKAVLPIGNPKGNNSEPLTIACGMGRLDMVELLLPVSDGGARYCRALYEAASGGHTLVVDYLVQHTAGRSFLALAGAVESAHPDIVRRLLPVIDINEDVGSVVCSASVALRVRPVKDPRIEEVVRLLWNWKGTPRAQFCTPMLVTDVIKAGLDDVAHEMVPYVDVMPVWERAVVNDYQKVRAFVLPVLQARGQVDLAWTQTIDENKALPVNWPAVDELSPYMPREDVEQALAKATGEMRISRRHLAQLDRQTLQEGLPGPVAPTAPRIRL